MSDIYDAEALPDVPAPEKPSVADRIQERTGVDIRAPFVSGGRSGGTRGTEHTHFHV